MAKRAPDHANHIGVRTLQYQDEKRQVPVIIEFWYPTEEKGAEEIRNASFPQQCKRYPIVFLSHGNRGDRRTLSWLAEYLVRNGFLAASVEHYGNASESFDLLRTLRFWERARDISYAIDQILADEELKNFIDSKKIGFAGYSLGGMTGLGLAGATAQNVKEIALEQQKKFKDIPQEAIEAVDFSEATQNYRDSRIHAFLLICPAVFVYPSQTLRQIRAPIGLIASLHDEVLAHEEHAYQIIEHLIPAKLKLFRKQISHLAFSNRAKKEGEKASPVHEEAAKFALSFFKEQLNLSQ